MQRGSGWSTHKGLQKMVAKARLEKVSCSNKVYRKVLIIALAGPGGVISEGECQWEARWTGSERWCLFPHFVVMYFLRNLLIADFTLFEGPTDHAGLDQVIKQEADLKTRNKLSMIAMTSLECMFSSLRGIRTQTCPCCRKNSLIHRITKCPETNQCVLYTFKGRRAITKYEKEKVVPHRAQRRQAKGAYLPLL
jgi:hypothetical protein